MGSDVVTTGQTNHGELENPTVIRRDPQVARSYVKTAKDQDMEYLDIPAFLRRQAD